MPDDIGELPDMGKLGLIGMQERARLLNGQMKIISQPGKGTTIIVEVPLNDSNTPREAKLRPKLLAAKRSPVDAGQDRTAK